MIAPLTPAAILRDLRGALADWVTAQKGFLSIAGDPLQVIELLAESPQGFRVILGWGGDKDATGQPQAGIVDHILEVTVSHGRGLQKIAGESLVGKDGAPVPNTPRPLFDLLSDVRAIVRKHEFPADVTNIHALYQGAEVVVLDGVPLDAYKLTFSLTAALPDSST